MSPTPSVGPAPTTDSKPVPDTARVLVVVGTRPEAIKLAPVIAALDRTVWARTSVVTTGQHETVVTDTLRLFDIKPDHELILQRGGGSVAQLQARLLGELAGCLERARPDLVLVQGDTASALAGALAGFLNEIPVAHVEAGLRSGDLAAPFPEEGNRRLIAQIAALHLAPTPRAAANLGAEGLPAQRVVVTGNSVVDAVAAISARRFDYGDPRLESIDTSDAPLVVVTAHRRESWGEPLRRISRAVARIADEHPGTALVVAAHMNSSARAELESALSGKPNVHLAGPVPYGPFVRLMARASLLITDSGGIQEEAAALGVPVLVTRNVTERSEGIDAGLAYLVGSDDIAIVTQARRLLSVSGRDARPANPYGDGTAGQRAAQACGWLLGRGVKAADFRPGVAA